jgi:hypothetical protein
MYFAFPVVALLMAVPCWAIASYLYDEWCSYIVGWRENEAVFVLKWVWFQVGLGLGSSWRMRTCSGSASKRRGNGMLLERMLERCYAMSPRVEEAAFQTEYQ